jgi:lauroyl/myristoyl acyltransferase
MFAALLQHTPRAGEAAAVARLWMAEKSRISEIFWRPWLMRRGSLEGAEHWHSARQDERGFVLVFGHLSPMFAVPAVLAHQGLPFHIVVGAHYFEPKPPGYAGLEILRWRAYGEAVGRERMVVASASFQSLKDLIERGEVVGLAFDAPGRTPTPFLGRTVQLGGGAARLAFETGTKVLPVVSRRHGASTTLHLDPPLDASEFPDVSSLQAALARRFEHFVLEKPEAIQLAWDPLPLIVDAPAPREE